ncbi:MULTISPECIES: cupin domain-containing protein [Bradyrhizobium]|uniref:cupin domain-containing protein n=1 Tax=Bradyrhizobium elkanii TaxID=29448 RepID=UPI002714A407|nr:cupin domain-containing protein [Bradyrhizobium elkanii]WLB80920.1 cupin domain-containing protein [Bradyrhizobium elkanii]
MYLAKPITLPACAISKKLAGISQYHFQGGTISMKTIVGLALTAMLVTPASAQDSPFRKELKRADLSGTNMEVITSISELKPGDTSMLHFHNGEESYYFLEGGTIELPDGKQVAIPTGAVGITMRDAPHGAYKVVGDKAIKLLTVHIVDKGKPLYDTPK